MPHVNSQIGCLAIAAAAQLLSQWILVFPFYYRSVFVNERSLGSHFLGVLGVLQQFALVDALTD